MRAILFWNLYLYMVEYIQCDLDDKMDFIKDFVIEKNLQVTLFVCWKDADIIEFQKKIWARNHNGVVIYNNLIKCDQFFRHASTHNLFLVDLINCPYGYTILEKANHSDLFNYPMKWLIVVSKKDYENFLETVNNYKLLPTSEFFLANFVDGHFILSQLYKIKIENSIIWENYGLWTKNNGFTGINKQMATSERRHDLRRAKLIISLHITDKNSLNHLEDFKYSRIDTFTKQDWGAIRNLLDYCNVDPIITTHNSYGYYNSTRKSWDGIIALMANSGTQLSNAMYYTPERFVVVDYIKMLNPFEIRFLLKKPPVSYEMNIFAVAFRDQVWMLIGATLIAFGFALLLILNVESKRKKLKQEQMRFTASDVILILFEAFGQQGSATDPKTISARILFIILFLAFMFLFVAYSAYIVVLLQSTKTIKTWKELADSRMGAGGLNTTYMRHYLMEPKLPIQRQIYQTKIGPDGFLSLDVGMEKVRKGYFAFHVELSSGYNYVLEKYSDSEICSLQELIGYNEDDYGYVPIPKRSPYKEIFKAGLFKIDEYGLQRRQNRRFYLVPRCYQEGGNFESVGLVECYQAVLILVIGILIAFIVLIIEKIVYNFRHNNSSQFH